MAEKALVAFGRYLKLLRERRGLSLDDVATLTKAYPEPVNKGYLSRAERGLSHIAFSKIIALGRAYEVPIDVFGEKLSLDLDVDQLKDAPETEGKTFAELLAEGMRLNGRGLRLQAYAVMRDALPRASIDPVAPNYESRREQNAAAGLTVGIRSGALGRFRVALHEIEYAESLDSLRTEFLPTAFMHLSTIYRRLGDFDRARAHGDRAIALAMSTGSDRFLADALSTRGVLADAVARYDDAVEFHKKAYSLYKGSGRIAESARAMTNLANAYFNATRYRASRRALEVAYRIASESGNEGTRARSRILLGEIEALEGRRPRAVALWLEALGIAKKAQDRVAAFKAEFQLFKNALGEGHTAPANAFGRRLNRLWPWIGPGEAEVQEFRALWLKHRPGRRRGVVTPQPAPQR